MDKEYKLLISLCSHYIEDKEFELEIDKSIDFKKLYKYAKAHNLLGIVYCAVSKMKNKNDLPSDFIKATQERFFDLIYIYEKQSNQLAELTKLLSSCSVQYIVFKGATLREIYPVHESRAMGDIDILIKEADRDKVKKLLTSNGFECVKQNGPVYNYTKDGVLFEIHTKLISQYDYGVFKNAFDRANFAQGCYGRFENDFHFAYLIAHTAHHFKFYGAGIKHALDLAVLLKIQDNDVKINLENVFKILEEYNLVFFAKVMLTVCCKFFGVGKDYGIDTRDVELYLCKCGAFGNAQDNKGITLARRELEEQGKYSPFKMKLRLIFPPYSKLKNIDYIKFIDGRPWLILYAWIYRIIYNLKNRKEFTKNAVSSLDDEKTLALAVKELEFFKEIGLE